MSYILDALRKSETERTQDVAPNLLTAQHMRARPRAALVWTLIGVLAVNAAVIGAWLWRPNAIRGAGPGVAPSSRPAQAPAVHAQAPAQRPTPTESNGAELRAEALPPAEEATAPSDAVEPSAVVGAAEIDVSSHVYSADPHARAITVAGRRYQEGDSIAPGIRLIEITETGIVVDDHGARRAVDVLNGWH